MMGGPPTPENSKVGIIQAHAFFLPLADHLKIYALDMALQGIQRWKKLPLTLNGQNARSSLYIFADTTPLFRKCAKI